MKNQFGSLFNLHVEDFDRYSLSHLHHGRKVWIVIHPASRVDWEKIMSHPKLLETRSCSQFIRHDNLFVLPDWLDFWRIPYHVVDQQAQEIVVTFPGTYHEGFSIGSGVSEACNYAAEDWIFNADLGCSGICGEDAVIVRAMRLDSPVTPAQMESPATGSTQVDPTSTHRQLRGKQVPFPAFPAVCVLTFVDREACAQPRLPGFLSTHWSQPP